MANLYRIIVHPTNDIWVRAYPDAESRTRDRVAPAWVIHDFDSEAEVKLVLPPDRSRRHAWRWVGTRVIADPAVPDPPKPRQALIDEVQAATTIAALKAAVLKLL